METEIWVMRHGPQEPIQDPLGGIVQPYAQLTQAGRCLIREIAAQSFSRRFKFCVCSPFVRTFETASLVREVIGESWDWIELDSRLAPQNIDAWNQLHERNPDLSGVRELFDAHRTLHLAEGADLFRELCRLNSFLDGGEVALAISHQPLIECAVAAALDSWPPTLTVPKGGIVSFRFTNSKFSGYMLI